MKSFFWFVAGCVMGMLLYGSPAEAQRNTVRLFGVFNNNPIALTATTDGYLNVVAH